MKKKEQSLEQPAVFRCNIRKAAIVLRSANDVAIQTVDGTKIIRDQGLVAEFNDNLFTTNNKEIIEAIESLPCFNKQVNEIIITRIDNIVDVDAINMDEEKT